VASSGKQNSGLPLPFVIVSFLYDIAYLLAGLLIKPAAVMECRRNHRAFFCVSPSLENGYAPTGYILDRGFLAAIGAASNAEQCVFHCSVSFLLFDSISGADFSLVMSMPEVLKCDLK
jgi:hypothetical protein